MASSAALSGVLLEVVSLAATTLPMVALMLCIKPDMAGLSDVIGEAHTPRVEHMQIPTTSSAWPPGPLLLEILACILSSIVRKAAGT